jgi:hypothetical protein
MLSSRQTLNARENARSIAEIMYNYQSPSNLENTSRNISKIGFDSKLSMDSSVTGFKIKVPVSVHTRPVSS